jgi:RNA polymerase sigma-70 factor (ECF subfamily)
MMRRHRVHLDALKPSLQEVAPLLEGTGHQRCESLVVLATMYRAFLKAWAHEHLPDHLRKRVHSSSIVQETMLRVHQRACEFAGQSVPQFEQYLLRIAQNIIVDLHRFHLAQRRSIRRDQSLEELESAAFWDSMRDLVSVPADERFAAADEAEYRAKQVQLALLQLPKHYQRIIRVHHEQGWTIERIAKKLDCTPGAARELLRRAIAKLKSKLDEIDDGSTSH